MRVSHVEFAHGGELLGAGCVQDFQYHLPSVDVDLLAVRILDCRVVTFDPHTLNELCGQAGLTHAAGAEDDDVVFSA